MERLGANAFFRLLILVDLLKKQIMTLISMRLKATYLVLATTAALSGVKNKISKVSYLVKKKKKKDAKIRILRIYISPHLIMWWITTIF